MRQARWAVIIWAVVTCCAIGQAYANDPQPADAPPAGPTPEAAPIAPGKFIPTFSILYAGQKTAQMMKEAARYDLIDAGNKALPPGLTWAALRQLNPHLKVILYAMGPGEYNTWEDFIPGEGWSWMTAHHGANSADRWTALDAHGDYLKGGKKERLMLIGNAAWQQYWLNGYSLLWADAPNRDVDGLFCDNTDYEWPSEEGWTRVGHPDETAVPADYYPNGVYAPEIWKAQAKVFLDRAVTWLADRNRIIIPNFGYMSKDPQSWHDLDSQPHPVFAAMEEGAFATPWGGKNQYTFYPEQGWLNQIQGMRQLKHIRALMLVHGLPDSKAPALSRLDVTDSSGSTRGWDVLWFGLTSFLQGYDDVRQNAYFGFTVWSYNQTYWLDEFDPAHLNLGHAIGESQRVDGAVGHCYVREFEAGWAVVNPTDTLAQGVPVPQGQARVLDHYTFEHSQTQPLVSRFDLPAHRGIILLKQDRHVGNAG